MISILHLRVGSVVRVWLVRFWACIPAVGFFVGHGNNLAVTLPNGFIVAARVNLASGFALMLDSFSEQVVVPFAGVVA